MISEMIELVKKKNDRTLSETESQIVTVLEELVARLR